jgi:hypothetical protein
LPDLLRRVAVLTILSVGGIGLLSPLTARSGVGETSPKARLLSAADGPARAVARSSRSDRDGSATLSLAQISAPVAPELLNEPPPAATPASVTMEATLYDLPTPYPVPTALPVVVPPTTGAIASGVATWYCCSSGYRGQAVVALPGALGGQYDAPPASRYVTVCADRCARLPVVDYCGCLWATASQKVADLSPEAWALVSDRGLSAGVIGVTIHLGG